MYACLSVCLSVRRNILSSVPLPCKYDADENDLCPIFRLGDIVSEANKNAGNPDATYDSIAIKVTTLTHTYHTFNGRLIHTYLHSIMRGGREGGGSMSHNAAECRCQ